MMTVEELRSELAVQLMQMHPWDLYHADENMDDATYYAAMNRAIALVQGKINTCLDLRPDTLGDDDT